MSHTPDYDSPSALKAFLEEREMGMQKKFGQNFLINPSARKKLADAVCLEENMSVWEVGPGLGALTNELLKRKARVCAFEIDRGFAKALSGIFSDEIEADCFELVIGDVLKTWKSQFEKKGAPDRFFGNLPYNVAATIIGDFITKGLRFEKSVVTVQKEVALRMEAQPGSNDYSSFSVLCQWAYEVKALMDLSGGSFWPRPNVDSRAVVMTKRENFPRCTHPLHFMQLQRSLFMSRRKTVKNNLGRFYSNQSLASEVLEKAGINPGIRAEKLSVDELLHLSDISASMQSLPLEMLG